MALGSIADLAQANAGLAAEVERLRLALFDVLNCEDCGGKGFEYHAIDDEDVEGVDCECRDRAERLLGDWRPDPAVYLAYTDESRGLT